MAYRDFGRTGMKVSPLWQGFNNTSKHLYTVDRSGFSRQFQTNALEPGPYLKRIL